MNRTSEPDYENSIPPTDVEQADDEQKPGLRQRLSTGVIFIFIGACVLLTAVVVAVWGGVRAGQNERGAQATQTTAADLSLQFDLGVQDLEAGNYALAAQRFRWILDRDAEYPGAVEQLAEAQRMMETDPEPGTATPIPPSEADTNDEKFAEAETLYNDNQWEAAIDRLQMLQATAPDYRTADVQNMLYESLKSLGLQYIRNDDRLEEGIILLDQAAMIKPLDDISDGERLIANLYVTAKSYWSLNWPVVIQNLNEIYRVAPNYRDVEDRLWEAYTTYAKQLWLAGSPCDSVDLYESAAQIRYTTEIKDNIEGATDACLNPTPTPTATGAPEQPIEGTPGEGTPQPPAEGEGAAQPSVAP